MSRLQVAVIGCGGRSRHSHLPILRGFEDVELVAVCDPVEAAREQAGEEFGIANRYASPEELLDGEQLDAAIVAVPAHLNAEVALPFLERGVPTLLEKPPGLRLEETIALRDAAAKSGVQAMVGWNRRFHPLIVRAREIVEERGPILQLVGEFHKSMAGFIARGGFPEVVMDNMLLESPIHAIDIVRALAGGEVAEVHSVVRRANSRYQDVHAALIRFDNDCVAQLTANYTTDARLERYEIHGCGVSAYLEGVSWAEIVRDGERERLSDPSSNGTPEQNRFFLDCVREDRPVGLPAANLDEAVKTMELAHAILDGLR